MRVLVTGGAGFIGCNLADRLAANGDQVVVFDSLARAGAEQNLAWLQERHGDRVIPVMADVRDRSAVEAMVREAGAVFHLAAQVAVTSSLVDPREDFDVNLGGAINVLEAARPGRTPVIFASTNKVYGDLADVPLEIVGEVYQPRDALLRGRGVSERRPLDFHTPYGCSKGAADQYVLDYARSFGVPACVMRMSCIYGPRQMGTEDQGWVAHFLIRAIQGQPIVIYGDGRQVRDILFVDDAVAAYVAGLARIETVSGRAFNLGGGPANAVSLRQVLGRVEDMLGRRPEVTFDDWRAGDQRYYVSDTTAVREALGLGDARPWKSGLHALAEWLQNRQPAPTAEVAA